MTAHRVEWFGREPTGGTLHVRPAAEQACVCRYDLPVDDQWHELGLSGAVLHVASRHPEVVTLWALHSGGPLLPRSFGVFGTGQVLPPDARHAGTALAAGGALVWHVFEKR